MLAALFAMASIVGGGASMYMSYKQSKYNQTALNAQAMAAQQQISYLQQVTQVQMAATMQIAQYNAQAVMQSASLNNQLLQLQRNNMLAAANNQITILRDNAKLAEDNATLSREQSINDADRIRQINRRLVGAQKAAYAKSGVTLEGTPDDVIYDSSLQGELDALLTSYKGDIEASRAMYQQRSFLQEAHFVKENALNTSNEYGMQATINVAEGRSRANALLFEAEMNNAVLGANTRATSFELSNRANSARLQADYVRRSRPWELLINATNTASSAGSAYYNPSFQS